MSKRRLSFITCILTLVFIFGSSMQAFAASNPAYIDNDCTSGSGYYNNKIGNWTYLTSGYNGDARLMKGSNNPLDDSHYQWGYNFPMEDTYLEVYLANAAFTDPEATYSVKQDDSDYYGYEFPFFNQNIAPSGWNELGSVSIHGMFLLDLRPDSGYHNYGTGADCIYEHYTN